MIFVHGRPATGKTGIVRAVLSGLEKQYAYVNTIDTVNERAILQLIIEQLRVQRKHHAASLPGATSIVQHDFMAEAAVLFPGSKARTAWVVLDNVQRLSASVLRSLLSLRHTSAAVSWVFISQAPLVGVLSLTMGQPTDLLHRLKVLHFRPYSQAECIQVMQQWQPKNDATSMQQQQQQQQLRRQVFAHEMIYRNAEDLQQDITAAYDVLAKDNSARSEPPAGAVQGGQAQESHIGFFATGLDSQTHLYPDENRVPGAETIYLPVFAKVLIVASYVASRTQESMDRINFDRGAKRMRRKRALAHDQQTSDAHLDEVRGRNLFGRERLLALFWSLLGAHLLEQEDENGSCFSTSRTTSREQQSAAVFGHVASLVASKMLLQVPECGLVGIKYACDMPYTCVQQLARDLKLDLKTYVH